MRRLAGLLAVALLLGAPAPAQTVSLSVQRTAQHIDVGGSGKVKIALGPSPSVHAYSIRIQYNPAILHCGSVQGLQFFGSGSFLFKQIDSVSGFVQVDEALLGAGGRSDPGELFEITFTGSGTGTSPLQFITTDLRDSFNAPIPVGTQDGEIQVGSVSAVRQNRDAEDRTVEVVNYPNPFNLSTTIVLSGVVRTPATIQIFSTVGQEVYRTVVDAAGHGETQLNWDAKNHSGKVVPSGMYLVRVNVNASVYWRRMLLVK